MPNSTSVFRSGATALITGGASGVGLAVAKLCASHSMNVHIADINEANLKAAQSDLKTSGKVQTHKLDVTSLSAWNDLKSSLAKDNIKLDFLHLNAGIGGDSPWNDNESFRRILDVNMYGILNGITTFSEAFDGNKGEQKAIVITGSKQGITNPPGRPAYNASKSAVKTLAEHLAFDFATSSPSTSVYLLVPGWTFTGLSGGGPGSTKAKPEGAWSGEQVAEYLYQKMDAGKFYVICPDNDVDWETDRKRMMWTMGDIVYERQPQSRWREDYKKEAAKTMEGMKLGAKQSD